MMASYMTFAGKRKGRHEIKVTDFMLDFRDPTQPKQTWQQMKASLKQYAQLHNAQIESHGDNRNIGREPDGTD